MKPVIFLPSPVKEQPQDVESQLLASQSSEGTDTMQVGSDCMSISGTSTSGMGTDKPGLVGKQSNNFASTANSAENAEHEMNVANGENGTGSEINANSSILSAQNFITPLVSDLCTEQTGITDAHLETAPTLEEALGQVFV